MHACMHAAADRQNNTLRRGRHAAACAARRSGTHCVTALPEPPPTLLAARALRPCCCAAAHNNAAQMPFWTAAYELRYFGVDLRRLVARSGRAFLYSEVGLGGADPDHT